MVERITGIKNNEDESPSPYGSDVFEELSSTLNNPLNASMTPLSTQVDKEQKIDDTTLQKQAKQLTAALEQDDERPVEADMGGQDTRLSDLSALFDPKMDQETRLHTGDHDPSMKPV